MKQIAVVVILLLAVGVQAQPAEIPVTKVPLKIGWIGPMTGPMNKYGAQPAAELAVEDINASGGIRGRPIKLIAEDAQGKGSLAVTAFQKLVKADGVRFIIGGHCTPESAAIAPLTLKFKVMALAVTTSSPKLTAVSPRFARTTYLSTVSGEKVADYAFQGAGVRRLAIVQEQTDYVLPVAQRVREVFAGQGGVVPVVYEVPYGETDFKTAALRIKNSVAEGVYMGFQAPEASGMLIRQLHEIGFSGKLFGNESAGAGASSARDSGSSFEGLVFAEAEFDTSHPRIAAFVQRFVKKFGGRGLPGGFHTADAYDAVRLLADTIGRCGEDVDEVAKCLRQVRDYDGVTGKISINSDGDGLRQVVLKQIDAEGKPQTLIQTGDFIFPRSAAP